MLWRRTRNTRADPNVLHGLQQYNVLVRFCVCTIYHKLKNFHVQGNISKKRDFYFCKWCGHVKREKREECENGWVKVKGSFDKKKNGLIQVLFRNGKLFITGRVYSIVRILQNNNVMK